ncbi:MAG: type II and III secretion system protein family protein [Alphaproteobacteria bacterium]
MKALRDFIKSHPRSVLICSAAFLTGFATPHKAQAAQAQPSAPAQEKSKAEHIDESFAISVHGGRLIRLPSPATNVFVADPEVADVQVPSPTSIYILGKKSGRTNLYALNQAGEAVLAASIDVTYDSGAIKAIYNQELPNSKITVHSVPGGVVLGGEASSESDVQHAVELVQAFLGSGDKVINQVSLNTPNQVNLRVRIAEMNRNVAKQLGFNWNGLFNDGTFQLGIEALQPGNIANPDVIRGALTKGHFNVTTLIDALAQQGIVTTLAEPNLTAVSGETASFLAGGEFPIPVADTPANNNGIAMITVEFKQFGVSLNFTPTVLSADRISLKVKPEVSQISNQFSFKSADIIIPGLQVRRAETTVELASGQSFAIAGLMDNRTTSAMSKLPGIGNLPVLGPFFQESELQRQEDELIIIVTPYIVQPIKVAQSQIPTPVDQFAPSTELGRDFGQHLAVPQKPEGSKGAVGAGGQSLIGNAGFYY